MVAAVASCGGGSSTSTSTSISSAASGGANGGGAAASAGSAVGVPAPEGVPGVLAYEVTSRSHTNGTVAYPIDPPVGGNHNPVWETCGFYTKPVRNEHAVHSLEHGAVWVTYRPDIGQPALDTLAARAKAEKYLLVSPKADNPAPIVASAWGRQLRVDRVDDPALEQFLIVYLGGDQIAPEPGASCKGGRGQPPDQPDALPR